MQRSIFYRSAGSTIQLIAYDCRVNNQSPLPKPVGKSRTASGLTRPTPLGRAVLTRLTRVTIIQRSAVSIGASVGCPYCRRGPVGNAAVAS